jgi:lactoylglutathione lyase
MSGVLLQPLLLGGNRVLDSRETVDHAFSVALAFGGTSDGLPGLRPEYHENYYGAYFRDPDGNKLCVACHSATA